MYQLHGAPLNAKTVGGPGKNTLLPPPLSGPACNLGECFVSLLFEPIAGKNVSHSDKYLCRFLKNALVAEKS